MSAVKHIQNPTVSIVLINKNHGHFLQSTIDSYINQSMKNLQIICMDGMSTDNSLDILAKYKEIITISGPDRSGSEAIVKGIKQVSGEYFMIATSNDVLVDPNFINTSVAAMENDKSISCVFGKVLAMSEKGEVGSEIYPYVDGYFGSPIINLKKWLLRGESFHECSVVFRTKVVLECIPNLESFADKIELIEEDLTFRLRYEFFRQGYMGSFINMAGIAVRDHPDRGSLNNNQYFRKHIEVYLDQIESFRADFLKSREYKFVDSDGKHLSSLSLINIYYCVAVLYLLKFKRRLGVIKRGLTKH
jgi:glycosyltransferase involved in cell wall biosynthesis